MSGRKCAAIGRALSGSKGNKHLQLAAAAVGLSLSVTAYGQDVIRVPLGSRWNNLDGLPSMPAGATSTYTPSTSFVGFASGAKNATSPDPLTVQGPPAVTYPGELLHLQLYGQTSLLGSFTEGLTSLETFTLSQTASVSMPTFLNGTFQLGTLNLITPDTADVTESLTITNTANNAVPLNSSLLVSLTGPNNAVQNVNDFIDPTTTLAAGKYVASVTLSIDGTQIISAPGLTDDFYTGTNGLTTSVEASPTGLPPSRAAIAAQAAQSGFFPANQNFSAVKVGLLENGNPFVNNVSLPPAQVTNVYPAGGGTNYPSEHALATAGIIGAVNANSENAGVAPGASIYSASYAAYSAAGSTALQALKDLAAKGITDCNMSFTGADLTSASLDQVLAGDSTLTFVCSAGNSGLGSIGAVKLAYDPIAVGAMNNTDTQPATFSSTGAAATTPIKPDIMAPGSYINAPQSIDANEDGTFNDFGQTFSGSSYYNVSNTAPNNGAISPIAGAVSGTSFAAPMVAGTVALLDQYDLNNPVLHTLDARVMKAVLLNSATRTGIQDSNNEAWANTTVPPAGPAFNMNAGALVPAGSTITRSLDTQLGSGMVNAAAALAQFQPNAINSMQQANTNAHIIINTPLNNEAIGPNVLPYNANCLINGNMWDQEQVAGGGGMVDYLLGDLDGQHIKATLDWNAGAGNVLSNLELSLWQEGANGGNQPGFDAQDEMIATTSNAGENVKLFDFTVPNIDDEDSYYLEVIDNSGSNVNYGLAINVPEPGTLGLALGIPLLLARRRKTV
jgi:Subtilase family